MNPEQVPTNVILNRRKVEAAKGYFVTIPSMSIEYDEEGLLLRVIIDVPITVDVGRGIVK